MLIDCIAAHARFRGRQPAMVDLGSGRRWNYAALDADVNQTAHWLIAALGPASGARIAVLARNCAEMVILQLAAERAGGNLRAAQLAPRAGRNCRADRRCRSGIADDGIGF